MEEEDITSRSNDIEIDQETFANLSGTEEIPKFNQICRVCLCETNESVQQLNTRILVLNNAQEIRSLLEEATGVEIFDLDFLPNQICDKCLKTLTDWSRLRSQTQLSNEILKDYLKKISASLHNTNLNNVAPTQIEGFEISIVKDEPDESDFDFHHDSCAMTFTNQDDLDKHQEEHLKPTKLRSFKCALCPKSFAFREGMHNHMELCHDWKRYKFQCDVCGKPYHTPVGMKMHKTKPCVPADLIEQCKTQQLDVRKKELIAVAEKTIKNTKISCTLCKKDFKRYENFIEHFSTHMDDTKCRSCHKNFTNAKLLERHVRTHSRETAYACSICTRSFYAFEPFRSHVHEHGKREWIYRCNICKKEFFIHREFEKHMIKHLKAIEDEKKALRKAKQNDVSAMVGIENDYSTEIGDECDSNTFAEDESAYQMERLNPDNQKSFQLIKVEEDSEEDEPNKTEKGTSEEDDSKNVSTDKMETKVSQCENLSQLVKVEEDSEIDGPNKPKKDKLIQTRVDNIIDSKQQIQLKETDNQEHSSSISQLKSDKHTDASELKKETTDLKDIVKSENPSLDNSSSEEENADESDDDVSTFSKSNDQISINYSAYTKELLDKCKLNCHIAGCQAKCSNIVQIWKHFKKEHLPKKKPYTCSMCFEQFEYQTLFQFHIKRYYSFECPVCLKIKKNGCELKRHVLLTHSNERPFKCSKCDKTFRALKCLKSHTITHNNKKEFVCSICSKDFFSYGGLNMHSKTHKDIKELQCPNCSRQFSNNYRLKRHIDRSCDRILKKKKNAIS